MPDIVYCLQMEAEAGYTLTMNGPVKNPGRFFGGADMEDMWFATKKNAWTTTDKALAEQCAKRYGCLDIRKFIVKRLDEVKDD